jgi:restriction endonuclease S subunit
LEHWKRYIKNTHSKSATEHNIFICDGKDIVEQGRLDVLYQHPWRKTADEHLKKCAYPTPKLSELVSERRQTVVPNIIMPDETIRYMGLTNICANTGQYYVEETRGDNIKSAVKLFKAGDIIFSKLRPELRKSVLIQQNEEEGYVSSECFVFSCANEASNPNQQVEDEYLSIMLRSDLVFGQIIFQCTGLGRPRVSKTSVLDIKIPLPPIDKQREVVSSFRKLQRRHSSLKAQGQKAFDEADRLIASAYSDIHKVALLTKK